MHRALTRLPHSDHCACRHRVCLHSYMTSHETLKNTITSEGPSDASNLYNYGDQPH